MIGNLHHVGVRVGRPGLEDANQWHSFEVGVGDTSDHISRADALDSDRQSRGVESCAVIGRGNRDGRFVRHVDEIHTGFSSGLHGVHRKP